MAVLQNTKWQEALKTRFNTKVASWQETLKTRFNIDISSYRAAVYVAATLIILGGSWVIGATDQGIMVIAGIIGLVMGAIVMINPHIGLYILVVFIYTNLPTVLSDAFGLPSLNKILVILIFVSVIGTQVMIRHKPLVFRLTEGAILLYLIVAASSTMIGKGLTNDSFDQIVDTAKDFLLVFIIVQLASEEQVWKRAQYMLIGCAVFLCVLSIYQFTTNDYAQTFYGFATNRTDSEGNEDVTIDFYRVGGPVGDPNFYAQILLMVYPVALYRVLDKNSSRDMKLFGAISTLIIAMVIVFTYSRGALLVFGLITFLILVERRINLYKVGFLVILGAVLVFPLLPTGYQERMLTIIDVGGAVVGGGDVSARGRLSEALVAWNMFLDHPLFGVGYSHYGIYYQQYSIYIGLDRRSEDREAHNLYLEAAAETGIVGVVTMFFMFAVIFDAIRKARRELIELGRSDLVTWLVALQYGLIAYMVNSIFLHDSSIRYLRLSIALAVSATALVQSLRERQDAERKRKVLSQFDEAAPKLAETLM
jgi:putative inorganic carbon (hco3(-)) transporter